MTITLVFGPLGYMLPPYTNQPVTDLWEVNEWLENLTRHDFEAWIAQ